MKKKTAIVVGAGPAGLVAAYELLSKSQNYNVIVLEETNIVGGISRTIKYKGNRMDMGGHRFFSKIDEVNDWWEKMLPTQGALPYDDKKLKRKSTIKKGGPNPEKTDRVMLRRNRLSRIFFNQKFFDYPVSLKPSTIKNMGLGTTIIVGFSYLKSVIHKRPENSLEDFYINRFGKKLYSMFFENYTENLWGRHPRDISPEWGAQRVKGMSISAIIKDIFGKLFKRNNRKVETSLIEEFAYPKLGPGQLWEITAKEIKNMGEKIIMNAKVTQINKNNKNTITGVTYEKDGKQVFCKGDYIISSMAIKDLVLAMNDVPRKYTKIAEGLPYREFMTVGVLISKMALQNETNIKTLGNIVPDNWVYVHDKNVKMGRFQIFNNWSPYMVKDPEHSVWIGLEYFCNEGDTLWSMKDKNFAKLAIDEMVKVGIIENSNEVIDYHVERVKKAYPAYFDTYEQIDDLRSYLDKIPNLFCVGRNGQHRYNNLDHSMCTSFEATKNILNGITDKKNVWNVNTEKNYHEGKDNKNDEKNTSKKMLSSRIGLIATVLISGLAFFGIIKSMPPENISNMGGTHSWLSGSTITFVNNWLDEGATNLHFTNYDVPTSVEADTLEKRAPYLSYPTGETFFVFLAAKLTGKQQITIPFLHKFQIILFGIETLLFAAFIYYLLTRTLHIKSEIKKITISTLTSTLWVLLPTCFYYLPNVFFADQCVILWAMGIILVEYLIRTSNTNSLVLKGLRAIILFSGFLIDYYFWFLAAFLFIAEIANTWQKNQKGKRKKEILKILLWFGIPIILAILTYFIQLNMTPNWLGIMKEKFGIRIVGEGKTIEWIIGAIFYNFIDAFSSFNDTTYIYLLVLVAISIIGTVTIIIKNHKLPLIIKNAGLSIIVCNILAIIFQLFFFKQHSAIHEFSMIKVAWIIALLPLFLSIICYYILIPNKKGSIGISHATESKYFIMYILGFTLVLFALGIPNSTNNFSASRIELKDYSFESVVKEKTDYYDVLFSYSEEILRIPPQPLAISKKRIYKIQNIDEIASKMSGLDQNAKTVLVVNKGVNLEKSLQKQIKCLKNIGKIRWEDDYYILIDVNNYTACQNHVNQPFTLSPN